MQNDPFVERQRLGELYSKMYDDELINLAIDAADLTATAQEVLRQEMRTRGLGEPQEAIKARTIPEPRLERRAPMLGNQGGASQLILDSRDTLDESTGPQEFTWKTLLGECETTKQARQLSEVLKRAGIESWIEGPGSYSRYSGLNLANPRVVVAADQLEDARRVLSQPIPEEIIDDSKTTVPEFELPVCPKCGAADPALEGVDPFNTWRCEACGYQWTESGAGVSQEADGGE
jgi:hypothetical protein